MKKHRIPFRATLLRRSTIISMDAMTFYTLAGDWFTRKRSQLSTLRRQRFEFNRTGHKPHYVSYVDEARWKEAHYPRWIWNRIKKGYPT